jgi:hypothetical protein
MVELLMPEYEHTIVGLGLAGAFERCHCEVREDET